MCDKFPSRAFRARPTVPLQFTSASPSDLPFLPSSFLLPHAHHARHKKRKMLSHVFRLARPAARLNVWSKPTTTTSSRAFTVSATRKSGHPSPQLLGEGGKAGEVPTDINQSTGLERLQTLGFLEGVDVFDSQPLDSSRIGTLDNPVLVYSLVRHSLSLFLSLFYRPPIPYVFGVFELTFCFSFCVFEFLGCRARHWMHWVSCGFS